MATRPRLARLAHRLGILPRYVDTSGTTRETPERTYESLVTALGFDGATEDSATRALHALDATATAQPIEATRVTSPANAHYLPVTFPPRLVGKTALEWHVEIRDEAGRRTTAAGRLTRGGTAARCTLPHTPMHGYHQVRLHLHAHGAPEVEAEQTLIVVPPRCPLPSERIGNRGADRFL